MDRDEERGRGEVTLIEVTVMTASEVRVDAIRMSGRESRGWREARGRVKGVSQDDKGARTEGK
jgi:hypothetical protein